MSDSAYLWTVTRQAPLSMGFSRQEYWSGLLCLPPVYLPNTEIEPTSLTSPALAGGFFTTSTTWETCRCAPMHAKLLQLCPPFCSPMDWSLPSSAVHGILQARILEWIAMPSFRGSSLPRNGTSLFYVYLQRQADSLDAGSILRLESSSGEGKNNPVNPK